MRFVEWKESFEKRISRKQTSDPKLDNHRDPTRLIISPLSLSLSSNIRPERIEEKLFKRFFTMKKNERKKNYLARRYYISLRTSWPRSSFLFQFLLAPREGAILSGRFYSVNAARPTDHGFN